MTALHSWHSLNQLHLECFSNSFEGVPTYADHFLAAFSSLLWRTGHLMQHTITLIGQIALTQPGGLLGHCPVEKQMIVPLSPNQMGWRITAECCGSHADSITSKAPPHHNTSPSMLYSGKYTYGDLHPHSVSQRHSG